MEEIIKKIHNEEIEAEKKIKEAQSIKKKKIAFLF